jgi:hypothetical protein
MSKPQHVPVLLDEVLQYLNVRPGGVIADTTVGLGGHSSEIAKRLGAKGRLICFDRDPEAMELAKARLEEVRAEIGSEMPEVIFQPRAFSEAADAIEPASLDGLLADFGFSSLQLRGTQRIQFPVGRSTGHADGYASGGDGRASGKSGRRKRTRRPDLRIRRGKEVAENRQSHCEGPADIDDSGTRSSDIGRGPFNERRQDTSRDEDLSSASNSSE